MRPRRSRTIVASNRRRRPRIVVLAHECDGLAAERVEVGVVLDDEGHVGSGVGDQDVAEPSDLQERDRPPGAAADARHHPAPMHASPGPARRRTGAAASGADARSRHPCARRRSMPSRWRRRVSERGEGGRVHLGGGRRVVIRPPAHAGTGPREVGAGSRTRGRCAAASSRAPLRVRSRFAVDRNSTPWPSRAAAAPRGPARGPSPACSRSRW